MRSIVLWPLAVALACSGSGSPNSSVNTTSPPATIEVSTVRNAVSVSAVEQPITVSSVTGPVAVSSVTQPVAVSGIASPVTVAPVTLAGPVTLSGPIVVTRPDLDPDRIETGDQNTGNPVACATTLFPCKVLVSGPFILTDAILTRGDAKLFAATDPTGTSAIRWTLSLTDHVRAGYDVLQTSGTMSTPSGTNYVSLTTSVPGSTSAVAGARLAVRAGEKLYVSGVGATFTWSGFRP